MMLECNLELFSRVDLLAKPTSVRVLLRTGICIEAQDIHAIYLVRPSWASVGWSEPENRHTGYLSSATLLGVCGLE